MLILSKNKHDYMEMLLCKFMQCVCTVHMGVGHSLYLHAYIMNSCSISFVFYIVFYFRLPPNSFTSLYHDNAEESLVKGSVHVEYVGLVFVGGRIHIFILAASAGSVGEYTVIVWKKISN